VVVPNSYRCSHSHPYPKNGLPGGEHSRVRPSLVLQAIDNQRTVSGRESFQQQLWRRAQWCTSTVAYEHSRVRAQWRTSTVVFVISGAEHSGERSQWTKSTVEKEDSPRSDQELPGTRMAALGPLAESTAVHLEVTHARLKRRFAGDLVRPPCEYFLLIEVQWYSVALQGSTTVVQWHSGAPGSDPCPAHVQIRRDSV